MRCLIIYFSLTHSTRRIAENIALGLRQALVDTDIVNIRNSVVPDISSYDLIGFGTPVYGFRIPVPVTDCIARLPDLGDKKIFAFMLRGSYMFNSSRFLQKALKKKNANILGWFFCYGAGYFVPYLRRGCLASPDRPNEADFEQARRFGADMGGTHRKDNWTEISARPPLLYRIEQVAFSPWVIKHFMQQKHVFDKDKCIRCGKCIKNCPSGNLAANSDGFPQVGNFCITCRHCLFVCPSGALDVPESGLEKSITDYNVRKVLADKTINKAAVRIRNGNIEAIGSESGK